MYVHPRSNSADILKIEPFMTFVYSREFLFFF
uniref:Uncharacterized protein n=1 Tax=Anguilla anguilla TaxID=7936 RepID=A0A0E9W4W5_ANGAN